MFKIVKKSDFEHLQSKIISIGQKLSGYEEDLHEANNKIEEYQKLNHDLDLTIAELKNQIETFNKSDESHQLIANVNSVELVIADDLTKVTPIVKFRRDVFEKMVELGYLSDKDEGSDIAIQLALMTIAHEALDQIIESFSQPVEED